jgi:hypothetical protein
MGHVGALASCAGAGPETTMQGLVCFFHGDPARNLKGWLEYVEISKALKIPGFKDGRGAKLHCALAGSEQNAFSRLNSECAPLVPSEIP